MISNGITLAKTQDLVFGGIIPAGGGTVTINVPLGAAPTVTRTKTGTLILAASAPWGAATFSVSRTGNGNPQFMVTLPASVAINNTSGPGSMTVTGLMHNAKTSNPYDKAPFTLYVGGTLTVAAGQTPGLYTGTFLVQVDQK